MGTTMTAENTDRYTMTPDSSGHRIHSENEHVHLDWSDAHEGRCCMTVQDEDGGEACVYVDAATLRDLCIRFLADHGLDT